VLPQPVLVIVGSFSQEKKRSCSSRSETVGQKIPGELTESQRPKHGLEYGLKPTTHKKALKYQGFNENCGGSVGIRTFSIAV